MTVTQQPRQLHAALSLRRDLHAVSNAAHSPQLAFVLADDRFVWITDYGRRIGLIDRNCATLEWIAPHPGIEPPRPAEIPQVYHAPAFQGGRIVLQWWLDDGAGRRRDASDRLSSPFGVLQTHPRSRRPVTRVQLGSIQGEELTLEATHSFDGDSRIVGWHRVRLRFDEAFNTYVADVEAELTAPDPYLVEFANLYAGGVYDNRPLTKRYQHTIWQHPDGRWVRWPHNPVSYLTPGMNDHAGERRISNGGFIGFFADRHSNPLIEIIDADPPAAAATCANLYDEHLLCLPADVSNDGLYRWRASYRFFSISFECAQRIVDQSSPVRMGINSGAIDPMMVDPKGDDRPLGVRFLHNPQFPEFRYGEVNDFEQPVPCDRLIVGNMLWVSSSPNNPVFWDDVVGHSGHRSIRLRGDSIQPVVRTRLAGGPTLHLEGGATYRLRGWIRTDAVSGAGAAIRMDVIGQHTDPPRAIFRTDPCRETSDWRCRAYVFQVPTDAELGWLYLELHGPGTAWFDDISLEEC